MKKLKLLIVVFSVVALMGFSYEEDSNSKYIDEVKTRSSDSIKPVISFIDEDSEEEIVLVEGSTLNLSDYIEVSDNVGVKAISSFGKFNAETPGNYKITVIAADAAENIATKDVDVRVITEAEQAQILEEQAAREAEEAIQREIEYLANLSATLQANDVYVSDIWSLAESYIGMSGWCNEVAQAFLTQYLGREVNIYNSYEISAAEARPGDLVEYKNGGNGSWHVAVYLGNEMALHGNWKGTTVIASIYVSGASSPYFVRVN